MIKLKGIVITGIVVSALIALPGYSQGHRTGGSSATTNREQSVGSNSKRTESPSNSSGNRGQGQNSSDYNNGRRPQGGGDNSGVAAPGATSSGNRTPNRPPAYLPGYREDHSGKGQGNPGHATGSQGVAPPGSGNYNNSRYYQHGRYLPPPERPYRPYCRPVPRLLPPPNYRPYVGAAYINSILGLTFGVAYMASLDYLYDNGYNVDGYNQNTVYLRNVQQLSYMWPDATLNYDSRGQLSNMQFIYSSSYSSTSRYDNIYRDLCRNYGSPVTYRRTSTGYEGVWYGAGAQNYVTLEYDASYIKGQRRYFTILSYGY